jgi:type IV pilus assembly protein PilY1
VGRAAVSGGRYVSPSANSCGRNFVIFIANGSPGEVTDNEARDLLQAAGGSIAPITYPSSQVTNSDQANWADEMARFMRGVDVSGKDDAQGIVTHGVAVTGASSDGDYPNFIRSIANHGGGKYYEASSADALEAALLDIFFQIQAVNSVFASASLPVSVNARGTYLNQIYMGMFRPDAEGRPRWSGNLKQYRFGLDALDNLFIVDADGHPAISAVTGFVNPGAVSFWTSHSSFWANQPIGTPPSASDRPDGEVVEKGGIAQRLRTSTPLAGRPQAADLHRLRRRHHAGGQRGHAVRQRQRGAHTGTCWAPPTAAERELLIDWLRGTANAGDETGPTTTPATTVRPSIHGDVLHSRPAVVNYGGDTGVVVFYGANDGQLRAVRGRQSGTGAGDELWSFVPEEVLPRLKRLRDNGPKVALSTTPAGWAPRRATTSSTGRSASTRSWPAAAQRARDHRRRPAPRRPRALCARRDGPDGAEVPVEEDTVVDRHVPARPDLVGAEGGAHQGPREPGADRRRRLRRGGRGRLEPGRDDDGQRCLRARRAGRHAAEDLHALNGVTPSAVIGRSIAADVAIVDADYDGRVDRAYAVDLGGRVYRIDFESADGHAPADWTIHPVADLGGGTTSGRKFFYPPDVVVTKNFTALLVGSGDREKPLRADTQDHFFQLFDRRLVKGAPALATPITWADLTAASDTPSVDGAGCYMALATGEKVVNAAVTIGGQPTSAPTGRRLRAA